MPITQMIIETLHTQGYSDEFIAKAINFIREQPPGLLDGLKSAIQFIVDNEYLINCRKEKRSDAEEEI